MHFAKWSSMLWIMRASLDWKSLRKIFICCKDSMRTTLIWSWRPQSPTFSIVSTSLDSSLMLQASSVIGRILLPSSSRHDRCRMNFGSSTRIGKLDLTILNSYASTSGRTHTAMIKQLWRKLEDRLAQSHYKPTSLIGRITLINHIILSALWYILTL